MFKIKMIQALCFPFDVFYCIFNPQITVYTLLALLYHCWFKLDLKKKLTSKLVNLMLSFKR